MNCLGCGADIGWDGKGILAYTCPCGATIFYEESTNKIAPPASLITCIYNKEPLPHIDYYLGKSSMWSPRKEEMYKLLKRYGCNWSWECSKCRDRVIEKTEQQLKYNLYLLPFHPDLLTLVNPSARGPQIKE